MTVGLAGKACSGKDSLVPFFERRGFTVLDADKLGHAALEANRTAVVARFGTADRSALGRIVFPDPRALADLEAISHPWIAAELRRLIAEAPGDVLINAALLHKLPLKPACDLVVWVEAPLLTRVLRARRRDHWSWRRIFDRIRAQRSLRPQVFPPGTDILRVENRGPLELALRRLEERFGSGSAKQEDRQ